MRCIVMKNITTIINIKNIYNKCERLSTVLSSNSFSSKSSIFGVRVSEAIITYLKTLRHWNLDITIELLGIRNDFLYPSHSKIREKEPQYSEQILPAPSPFVKSRFRCITVDCGREKKNVTLTTSTAVYVQHRSPRP